MIHEGEKAPLFKLPGSDGKEHSLSDFRGKKIVLYFYPKDDTPGCTTEACGFRDAMQQIRKKGAEVIGISRDGVSSHQKFASKYNLNFLLLADESGETCEAYGVIQEKNMYGKKVLGIVRSTFIIDEKGTIERIFSPVKPAGHEMEVLKAI
ncbi:MAG: thioredoxin-dependent thiol peroxidase [Methanomassiliicoccales archaeon]